MQMELPVIDKHKDLRYPLRYKTSLPVRKKLQARVLTLEYSEYEDHQPGFSSGEIHHMAPEHESQNCDNQRYGHGGEQKSNGQIGTHLELFFSRSFNHFIWKKY